MLRLSSLRTRCRLSCTPISLLSVLLATLLATPAIADTDDAVSDSEVEAVPADTAPPAQTSTEASGTEKAPAAKAAETPAGDEAQDDQPTKATPATAMAAVARLVSGSRVGGGVLVAPDLVMTLLDRVGLGYRVDVRLGNGHQATGRISKVDKARGLALVRLDEPAPASGVATLATRPAARGDAVTIIGHGGSVGLSADYAELRGLTSFSTVQAQVAADAYERPGDYDGDWATNFLVDRSAGSGDEGSPVFSASGELLGLLRGAVEGGGGRGLVAATADLRRLLDAPEPERAYRKPHHMQSWAGFGVAFHNRPSHIAGLVTLGLRIAFLDALRLEPWFEVDMGSRAAIQTPVERPRDLWWSVEGGLSFGYRLPLFSEGSRSYVVPTAGLRLGWNRFQHNQQSLVPSCQDGDCSWIVQKTTDQERSFRAGADLGVDVRHGKIRIGYRYFLSPADMKGHAMHRIVMTVDGWPIPLGLGDTH
ncbi:MAG TPA: hypothetical protein DIU15_11875 [Deltaproteobacteria bacterium]|nr:hypothetical protein [Deltaproteobacteria bacterium]HCP46737.1 hypothetical protein [Deltaproteobacteria bacterium]